MAGACPIVVVVGTTVVVVGPAVVVLDDTGVSHTSPTPSLSVSSWSLLQLPFVEHPTTQSASLLQVAPARSEPGMQVPSSGPLGVEGQLSAASGIPSLSLSPVMDVEVVVGTVEVAVVVVVVGSMVVVEPVTQNMLSPTSAE